MLLYIISIELFYFPNVCARACVHARVNELVSVHVRYRSFPCEWREWAVEADFVKFVMIWSVWCLLISFLLHLIHLYVNRCYKLLIFTTSCILSYVTHFLSSSLGILVYSLELGLTVKLLKFNLVAWKMKGIYTDTILIITGDSLWPQQSFYHSIQVQNNMETMNIPYLPNTLVQQQSNMRGPGEFPCPQCFKIYKYV